MELDLTLQRVKSAQQLVGHYAAEIMAFKQGHLTPYNFPDSFSLKRDTPIQFESVPILFDTSVATALEAIKTHVQKPGTGPYYRVPPLAITSMARSGKTTLLQTIFNKLLEEGQFNPILVDFNGGGEFSLQDGESDYDGFLRWVATSLLYDDPKTAPRRICRQQELEEYLSDSPKPIVLMVDELNALTGNNPSQDLAKLLRQMFLDQSDRYLCFTSHWFMNLEQVVGRAREGIPSPRATEFVHVPRTLNPKQINKVLPSANTTAVQLAACLGSVGLIFSKHKEGYEPSVRFKKRMQARELYPVESFLVEFCSGDEEHRDMRDFDEYTTRLDSGKIAWPLCFAKPFLLKAGEYQLHALIEHTEHSIGLQTFDSGLEWEFTARVAVAIVARSSMFRDLTRIEAQVIGVPEDCRPEKFRIVTLPEKIQDVESAQKHLRDVMEKDRAARQLVVAYPSHTNFNIFDTITCFKASEVSSIKFTGQQMKQRDNVPGQDAPFDGVLLRGDGPEKQTGALTRQNWRYLGHEQIKEFLPYSLQPLIPSAWLKEKRRR